MGPELRDYLIVGLSAAGATAIATPIVIRLARTRGWVVAPNARSVHTSPIPHVGGLAMLVGFLVAMLVARSSGSFDAVFVDNGELVGIVIAVLIVFAVGFADDIVDLAPPGKVTGIVIAGVVLSWYGATIIYFRIPFYDVLILSSDWTPLVTVLWLLGMTQAINLIDGLDGLAAGIVAIGASAFFLYAFKLGELGLLLPDNSGPLLAIVAAGVCAGFLPYNFNPARVFMGDSGAFLVGAMLAVSTSIVGGRADPNTQAFVGQTFFFFAPLAIPLLILGVPMLDTAFAIVRRASKRQAIDIADKGHLHHRLMNLGHGHRRSVLILWTWTALLAAFVLYPVLTDDNPRYLPFGVGALGIVLFTVLHPSVRRKRAEQVEAALDRPAFEQLDPDRPERREAQIEAGGSPRDPSPDDVPQGAPAGTVVGAEVSAAPDEVSTDTTIDVSGGTTIDVSTGGSTDATIDRSDVADGAPSPGAGEDRSSELPAGEAGE